MNEAETRAELIDPKLREAGWGVVDGAKILRERHITDGKIQTGGGRGKPLITDYILVYKNRQLAVIEAKSAELGVGEGVGQAKNYAIKLHLAFAYSTNGKEIYEINMRGGEGTLAKFPTPDELGTKHLRPPRAIIGTTRSTSSPMKILAAQNPRAIIKRSPSITSWRQLPITNRAFC